MIIGFAGNPLKERSLSVRDELRSAAEQRGHETLLYKSEEDVAADGRIPSMIVIVGGDGSLLRYAPVAAERNIPILGVNLGRVGFLCEITPEGFTEALQKIESGEGYSEQHELLRFSVNGGQQQYALNDITIYKNTFSGVAQINVSVENNSMGDIFCDGVILSTPTGSTAYSLSAGGPVLYGSISAMAITPVCPHTLHIRPVVCGGSSPVTIGVKGRCIITADGKTVGTLSDADRIEASLSGLYCGFLRLEQRNPFAALKNKLI